MSATPRTAGGSRGTRRWFVPVLVLAALLGVSSRAGAQWCRVKVDTSLAFGSYNVLANKNVDTDGQLSWRCTVLPFAVQITFSRGQNPNGTQRRLRGSGGDFLRYDLYRDSARTILWGDGTFGSAYTATYPGSGWVTVRIFGRIPASQDVGVGSYTDSTVVTINF